ncbi:hypothetical protein [Microbacterium amylolyticum]|uniref:Uncharacterized protein n=1 Tax=Microbacterium amylolyticum TaxID=936337 RepID=A0ABS4ZGC1_9MICO|nr:hypothetical protein [Microbacterium amylolyticum]MBP2436333.1 hypothetical protein [Microbacterium amylolyticum]
MRLEPLLRRVDRLAGGRYRDAQVPGAASPGAAAPLWTVFWLLVVCTVLGGITVATVGVLTLQGAPPPLLVWLRVGVLFAISVSLFYFLWRASIGWYWAFQRLLLFSRVFPFVAIALALIPGAFPWWVVGEQIAFAAVLIIIQFVMISAPMKRAFPKPQRAASA